MFSVIFKNRALKSLQPFLPTVNSVGHQIITLLLGPEVTCNNWHEGFLWVKVLFLVKVQFPLYYSRSLSPCLWFEPFVLLAILFLVTRLKASFVCREGLFISEDYAKQQDGTASGLTGSEFRECPVGGSPNPFFVSWLRARRGSQAPSLCCLL